MGLPSLALLTRGNLLGDAQLIFTHIAMGNPLLWVPILYLALAGNHI